MQISVFYDHITQARQQTGKSLSQLLKACRGWGIEGLEINYTQLRKGGFGLRQEFRRAGMCVSCIYEFYDFTHNGDLKQAKEHVDLAAKVGADKVLIVPGFLEEQEARELEECCCGRKQGDDRLILAGQDPVESRREQEADTSASRFEAVARYMESHASICRVRDALRELVDYGRKKGIRITLEDFDGNTSPCARTLPLKWLMEQVPGLGYTLDMGNFAYSDEDVMPAYELLKPYIAHVHCKDRGVEKIYQLVGQETDRLSKDLRERPESMKALPDDAGKGSKDMKVQSGNVKYCRCCQGLACVPAGGGYLPIRELVIQLISQGYDSYLAIEHFDAPDQFAYMRRSAEFLKSICQRG